MTVWGNWHYTGGNGLRVGADWSIDPVDTNTGTFHVHVWYYLNTQYNYSGDVMSLNFSGWIGGSQGFTLNSGHNGVHLIAERDLYYNYTTWGSSPGNIQVNAQISGAYNGSTPSLFLDFPIYARPYAPPNNPNGVNAWRDASGTSASIVWNGPVDAQRPYTAVTIQHQTWSTAGWSGWYEQVTLETAGGPGAFVWDGLADNRIHAFRIIAHNQVALSGWVDAPWVYFTAAAPTNVTSSLSGSTIVTSWVNHHYSGIPHVTLRIERSVAGGPWVQVATGLAEQTSSWTDPSPGGGANQYRVKTFVDREGGLSSAWATGNVVSTVVPPLAPTMLWPNGAAIDVANSGVTLSWVHNSGADYAAQTHYTIETSANGGTSWQPLVTNVASGVSSHTVAAGVLTNGVTYLWRVRTQGGTTAAFGPFSAGATIIAQSRPVLTLDPAQPANPTVQLPLGVGWIYGQDQGVAQAGWVAELYAADGTTLLEQRSGFDTTTFVPFTFPVVDGATYVVRAQVMSGSGLWSAWASRTTTVDLPPPAAVTVTTAYDQCGSTMAVTMVPASPAVGEVPVATMDLERRVPAGEWVTLVRGLVGAVTVLDPVPVTNGVNAYRVTAWSTAPSVRVTPVVQGIGTDGSPGAGLWVSLAWGPGFHTLARVHGDVSIEEAASRVVKAQPFLGRAKPVLLAGTNTTRTVNVSGTIRYSLPCPAGGCLDTGPAGWTGAAQGAEVVCYRDYTGRRLFGLLSGISVVEGVYPGHASVSFTITEIDYVEKAGVVA